MINNLETNRLIIKSTKKEDTSFCLDIWLDDEMGKYLSDPPRDKADDAYLKWKDNVENYDGCYYFVAISKKTNNYIGTCSAVPSEDQKHWDLGYCVHKKYWRQGYATEMILYMIIIRTDLIWNNRESFKLEARLLNNNLKKG